MRVVAELPLDGIRLTAAPGAPTVVSIGVDGRWIDVITMYGETLNYTAEPGGILLCVAQSRAGPRELLEE